MDDDGLTLRTWLAGWANIAALATHHAAAGWTILADAIARPCVEHWTLYDAGDRRHLVPDFDAIAHEQDEGCACGPTAQLEPSDEGDCWTYRHHPLTRPAATEGP